MGWYLETFVWWLLHKTPRFRYSENWKWIFGATKLKTSSCNIVLHPKIHMCAQYGHIIINYIAILAITLVILPESHETSNMIAHFEKFFWDICNIQSLIFFIATMSHNMTPCKGFTLFRSFLNLLRLFQTIFKTAGMKIVSYDFYITQMCNIWV